MSRQELVERILGSLNEATLDDTCWPMASGLIDEACDSRGNFLVLGDGDSPDDVELFLARFCFRGQRREDLERLYFQAYYAHDERIPRIRRLPDGQVEHMSSFYTAEEMKTSPAYNEALPMSHSRDSLNVRLDGPNGSRIVWVAADPVDGDGWSSARVETVRRLLPHIRQFVRIRQALVDARALGSSVTALLENTLCGVIELDPRGRIVAANDIAREILRSGDGLADRGGALHAVSPEDDSALQRLLARALPRFGSRGVSGSLMVKRAAAWPRLVLHALPLVDRWMDSRPSTVAALMLVVDPANRRRIDPGVVETVLGFTPAESQVAALLAQGYTTRDIALSTGRSEGTIRWHIKQIFAKHGFTRQVELVQLVTSLSDIPREKG